MSTIKAREDRTRVTQPTDEPSHLEPFADKVRSILVALGETPGREGLLKTPERVESSLRWLTQGYRMTVEQAVGDAVSRRPIKA
jgi:GTP cyclohydrolase I